MAAFKGDTSRQIVRLSAEPGEEAAGQRRPLIMICSSDQTEIS